MMNANNVLVRPDLHPLHTLVLLIFGEPDAYHEFRTPVLEWRIAQRDPHHDLFVELIRNELQSMTEATDIQDVTNRLVVCGCGLPAFNQRYL